MERVCIIGDGGWGTALATVLHSNGHEVTVWGPFADYTASIQACGENQTFLPGVKLPKEITWTSDRAEAVQDADVVVLAVPSRFYEEVATSFASLLPAQSKVASVTKGLSKTTHERMTQIAERLLGRSHVAALSGPSHAEEVARGIPTAVVIACDDHAVAESLQQTFTNRLFRVYSSTDVIGTELGGALKNVIAIAVGVSDGLGFGDNTKAALITRGLAEMSRLGIALGAHPATFAGLTGMGDLIVTCASKLSRNRAVGERLGKGESIQQIMDSMKMVAEGVWNCANAFALAQSVNIEVPITKEVTAVVHEGKDPRAAVESLLARDPNPERD